MSGEGGGALSSNAYPQVSVNRHLASLHHQDGTRQSFTDHAVTPRWVRRGGRGVTGYHLFDLEVEHVTEQFDVVGNVSRKL